MEFRRLTNTVLKSRNFMNRLVLITISLVSYYLQTYEVSENLIGLALLARIHHHIMQTLHPFLVCVQAFYQCPAFTTFL